MPSKPATNERWLDLSEAADHLGVHFTTLRRWADAGEVPCIRTPGGRRRFAPADLEQFLLGMQRGRQSYTLVPLETRALDMARRELQAGTPQQQHLLGHFGEEARSRFKGSGQRLLGLLIQYGSRNDTGDAFLEEARRLAADYGALCCQAGLSLSDTVKTFLFFGHSMLTTVQQAGALNGPNDEESLRLYHRMNGFLDAILLATIESHGQTQAPSTSQDCKG